MFGGAALYGAFPLAYGVILEALYLPLILMLCGLIFRGVAFEFRFKSSPQKRHWWDKAFIGGSLLATFSQGVVIGAYVSGIPVVDRQFAGGGLDWLAPFPLVCGVGLVIAYALLGSTWLLVKTEGMLESRMRLFTRPLALLLMARAQSTVSMRKPWYRARTNSVSLFDSRTAQPRRTRERATSASSRWSSGPKLPAV